MACKQVRALVKPLLGMFHGEPRAKKWRAAVGGGSALAARGRGDGHGGFGLQCELGAHVWLSRA